MRQPLQPLQPLQSLQSLHPVQQLQPLSLDSRWRRPSPLKPLNLQP